MRCFLVSLCMLPVALFGDWYNTQDGYYGSDYGYIDYSYQDRRELLIRATLSRLEVIMDRNSYVIPFMDYQEMIFHLKVLESAI